MASPNLSEIVATTILSRTRQIADNVTENNGLLTALKAKGKIKTFSGGTEIAQELSYQENQTAKWYSGYEKLNVAPSDVISAAKYAIKQLSVAVTMSGLEQLQNAGREQMIDLLAGRIDNATGTMKNTVSEGLYSDGTGSGGKQLTGLQSQVATSPSTGTVGGINRANHSFWRNQTVNAGTLTTDTTSDDYILKRMNEVWVKCVRGSDTPDLIVGDNNTWSLMWQAMQNQQRFTSMNGKMAKAGWQTLMFNSAEAILDGGIGGNAPSNTMYFLNCDYIHHRPHSRRNMVPLDKNRYSVDQDAMVQLILFAGNLTMSFAKAQGVLY